MTTTPRARIYISPPHMCGEERRLLLEAFDSNWIAPLGPHVDAFEREVCQLLGCGHAAALSSGTGALHLGLLLLGVKPGDRVICPTLTFAATANAIRYCGAEPVFIDAEPGSWNLDPALLAEELERMAAAGQLPAAVVAVDLYGQCADYGPIGEACARHGVPLLEDAAEALGASYGARPAGTLGALGVLSFNGNKIITTSGGGMLLSDDGEKIARARFLATQAKDPAPHFEHSTLGFNYRMSNLLAAVGRGQLTVLAQRVARRREINRRYREALRDLPGLDFMPEAGYGRSNCWLTCVTVDPRAFGESREDLRLRLEAENIESRPVWKPMHLQPVFRGRFRYLGRGVADDLFARGLCLPSGSALSDADQDRVIDLIRPR